MPVSIEFSDEQAEALRVFYLDKKSKIRKELDEVDRIIEKLGGGQHNEKVTRPYPDGYSSDAVWQDKVKYILRILGEATTPQIVEKLLDIEPAMDKRKTTGSVSAVLSTHSKDANGAFKKRDNERKEFVYSLNVKEYNSDIDDLG